MDGERNSPDRPSSSPTTSRARYGSRATPQSTRSGVSARARPGQADGRDGAVPGSGRSTLIHILAGLKPHLGTVRSRASRSRRSRDTNLTKLRRPPHRVRLPVLRSPPMPTAEENIHLPLFDRRRGGRARRLRRPGSREVGLGDPLTPPSPSELSGGRGAPSRDRTRARLTKPTGCSSPTSRPATSTPRPVRDPRLMRDSVDSYGRRR